MAGINFNDLKNKLTASFRHDSVSGDAMENSYDEDDRAEYEDDYDSEENEGYEEEVYDEAYDDQFEDEPAEEDYDDAEYDEQDYDDSYEGDGYVDDAYDDGEGQPYDDEEEDPETLGYNPDVFKSLKNGGDQYAGNGYYDNQGYDDQGYDDQGYDEEAYDEEGYNEEGYGDQSEDGEYADESEDSYEYAQDDGYEGENGGFIGYIMDNDWVMYLALVILPPLGIWLLWHKNKYDITLRTALSAASFIWFVILLIWLFAGGGSDDPTIPDVNFMPTGAVSTQTSAPSATPTIAPDVTQPAATPRVNTGTESNNGEEPSNATYVYATNSGVYYHTIENCGDLSNASKMTLDTAITRGKTACPDCAGGTNITGATTAVTYYATTRGQWYHTNPSCQSMTGATVVTESNAIKNGKTACPVCIGYYGTPKGKWYHCVSNCQGMNGAVTKTKKEWEADGKTACPTCLKDGKATGVTATTSTPTQTMVYATTNGTYFHTKANCTGMKDATYGSIATAVNMGKKACTKCVTTSTVYVFATTDGKYFHTKNNCTGMKGAQYVTIKTALGYKKTACPTCAKVFSGFSSSSSNSGNNNSGITNLSNNTVNTKDTATMVYATKNGTYFHTKNNCSGMKDAERMTYAQAINNKKKACPDCVTASKLTVFATGNGKYYHTKATCTGMKNAVAVSASTAIQNGKTACSTCAKALKTAFATPTPKTTATPKATATPKTTAKTTTSPTKATASTTVYLKANSECPYYHSAAKCPKQNISGATNTTLEYAISRGYTACPSCNPPAKY